jgi:hypothetical protein
MAIFSARRESPTAAWSTPEKIDVLKFVNVIDSYSFFLEGLEITEGGKSAVSWTRSLGNNPNTAHVEYSASIGTNFNDVDVAALALGHATEDLHLVAIGEKIWAEYSYYAKASSDAVARVGVVGSLASSKVWGPTSNQWVVEFGVKGGQPAIFSIKSDLAQKVLNISVRNSSGVWSTPKALVNLKYEIPSKFAVEIFTESNRTLVATVGKKGQDWEMGLDLTIVA